MGTMFSQLARRSTRMLVSGIFKQLRTFVVVPDVLSKFSKIRECFLLQMKRMMSATSVWEIEPKSKETTVNCFTLRRLVD